MCQNVDFMISADVALTKFGPKFNEAVVAEWLRRLTRNQFPSGSVGLNPTDCENILCWPGIVASVVECSPATRAARVRFPDDAEFFVSIIQGPVAGRGPAGPTF